MRRVGWSRDCPLAIAVLFIAIGRASAQQPSTPPSARPDSVIIRVVNMELRSAVQLIGQYLDRPLVFSGTAATLVTLETPQPVPRADVVRILRGLLDSQSFELVDDTASRIYRARPREPPPPRAQPPTTGQLQQSPASQQGSAVELFVIH